jgi:hypothetical protein
MANKYTHAPRVLAYRSVQNAATTDIPANLALVLDTTNTPTGGLPNVAKPATSSTPTTFEGISPSVLVNGRTGDVAKTPGDIVAGIASGTVSVDDLLTIDTGAAKEGWLKKTTTTADLVVGKCLENAADGAIFYLEIEPKAKL